MEAMDWDNFRFALAVAREGSHAAAARSLRTDAATVGRRLARLEGDLGGSLFVRQDGRWRPTPLGEATVAQAARMEEAGAAALLSGRDAAHLRRRVRVTATESLAELVLVPAIGRLHAVAPDIGIDLIPTAVRLDLAFRREADLALRLARPRDAATVSRRVGEIGFAAYAPSGTDARNLPWVAYDDDLADLPEEQWSRTLRQDAPVALRSSHATVLKEAVAQGAGIGVLPCFLGDADPRLRRLTEWPDAPRRPAWLVMPEALRRDPAVRRVADWIAEIFRDRRAALAGEAAD